MISEVLKTNSTLTELNLSSEKRKEKEKINTERIRRMK